MPSSKDQSERLGEIGSGHATTVTHFNSQKRKGDVSFGLMQEHGVANELAGPARHSHVVMGACEPPRSPVVALAGQTRGGSVFW